MAIYSKLRELRFKREERDGVDLTYEVLQRETGLAPATLARLYTREPLKRVDAETLDRLCEFFGVGLADLLEYRPGEASTPAPGSTQSAEGDLLADLPESEREEERRTLDARLADTGAGVPAEEAFTRARAIVAERRQGAAA